MVRTLPLAVLGATLIGVAVASNGLSQEAWSTQPPRPVADLSAPAPEARPWAAGQPGGVPPSRAPTGPSIAASLETQLRPTARPLQAPGRPRMRSFVATGPLVARVMDPAFGPVARPADLLIPDPPTRLAGASDLLCLAVAIYHEARNQTLDGQLAVASVILNRTKAPSRWGATPCAVVVPVQFSFLRQDGSFPSIPKDQAWAIAVEMAREALERGPSALVGRADHYHTPAVDPAWNNSMDQVVKIEDHIFFAEVQVRG